MSTSLEELMREASAVADLVRQRRLQQTTGQESSHELRALQEQLSRTWTAIRAARSERGTGSAERQTRPKWD